VSADEWKISIARARKPIGKLVSRKFQTKNHMTTLPGAPDGEYAVMEFDSSFEKKKKALETVVFMMDQDSAWRVSGYFVK
jgi:hypothetical protein